MSSHHNRPVRKIRRTPAVTLSAVACALLLSCAWRPVFAANAEIVMLLGKGERRAEPTTAPWQPASVNQKLNEGEFVRTLSDSQMAIVMPDRTQIRLNQNTQLQVKAIPEASSLSQSLLQMSFGRAWSQARPQTTVASGGTTDARRQRVVIQTPTATLGIRGTDWEVEVGPDGKTQLVVLSGVVEMSNAMGSVDVGRGEAAVAEAGKAPVKLVLVNPQDRVQWVSSWRPQPRRWSGADAQRLGAPVAKIESGDYSGAAAQLRPLASQDAAAAVLLADLLLYQGEAASARAVLAAHAKDGTGDSRAVVLLAHAMARDNQLAQGQALLAIALTRSPGNVDLLVAQGDLAILDGDDQRARAAYSQVIAAQPANPDAWYGIGLIESERENVKAARAALGQAQQLQPGSSKVAAELAATETFAGNLAAGRQMLQEVMAREPDNYQALTALGLNKLKSGQPAQALEDFLKAGSIEPHYSRAWLYSGITFYQLDERERAVQAFRKASELDEHDPMPYLYGSVVEGDALEYGAAIVSAQQAQQRMPFLKSLNQAANNQKGSANLGSALANFGMEEWAGYYATQSYSPYWGGSHLFLADRYTGKFNKNSELMSGYLTEPTVFGASNRNSSLVASPGNYGKVDVLLDRTDWNQAAAIGTINGLRVEPVPLAYFLSADLAKADARNDDSSARGRNFTLGLGMKPQYDVGLFGFVTNTRLDAQLRTPSLTNDPMVQTESRADLGANIKLAAENQLWFKAGTGKQVNDVSGFIVSPSTSDALNQAFGTNSFSPNGTLDAFHSSVTQSDAQLRHSFTSGPVQWSWGLEYSRQELTGGLAMGFAPAGINVTQLQTVRASDAYLSARFNGAGRYEVQGDLYWQEFRIHREDMSTLNVATVPPQLFTLENTIGDQNTSELNPRLGVKWQLAPLQSLRAVVQRWRRPASSGTLSSVDTVGIPVNDRLPTPGGLYERARLQLDGELGASTFGQLFADTEKVDNGIAGRRSAISGFEVTQLESLRNRPDVFTPHADLEDTPVFQEGRVDTLGLAVNYLVSRSQTVSMRYLYRHSWQTGANDGLLIPFVPRQYLQLGSQWALTGRWLVGATGTYRSERFRDDTNLDRINPGWAFGLTVYWETADKRSSVQGIADNLLSSRSAGNLPDPHLSLRYTYRF